MQRKLHWGIAALILLLIAAGGFMYWQWSQVQQLKEQLAQDAKRFEENDKVQHAISFGDSKPPDEPGFEWVRHNDHWDKVPIDMQITDVSDGNSQLASVDAAFIRSLVLDTLQKTEQELTESQRDQLKRALDYVQQNGITKAQLEQLKQSLEREVIYDARAASEKAENAKTAEEIKAEYDLLKKKHDIADKIAALNRQMNEIGVFSENGDLLPGNFSPEQIKEALRQRRELRQQRQRLYAEFNTLTEAHGNDD